MDVTGIGEVADAAGKIVDKIWPDKTQVEKDQAALQLQAMMAAFNLSKAQVDVDNTEAASTDKLQHWRGALGWVCVFAYAWHFILGPAFSYVVNIIAAAWGIGIPALPTVDIAPLATLTLGMLGLGGMHMFQQIKGVK
jgi:hypothetical protein